jgi:hypothetical protein
MIVRSRVRAAFAFAVALSLAVAAPVAARDNGPIDETVTVRASLSLVIDPVEIGYGTLEPGATSEAVEVTATVGAPAGVAWKISAEGSRFRAGDASMAPGVRWVRVGSGGEWRRLDDRAVITTNTAGGDGTVAMQVRVVIPDDQAPGTYHGSLEFRVSTARP